MRKIKDEGYILVIALWIAIVLFIFLTTLTAKIFIEKRQVNYYCPQITGV